MTDPKIREAATRFLRGDTSVPSFTYEFRAAMTAVAEHRPLAGPEVDLFDALERWESSGWPERASDVESLRAVATAALGEDQARVLRLSPDEALVLFELLHRWEEAGSVSQPDRAEGIALSALSAALESRLIEPFDPDYGALLAEAKGRLDGSA
jgi:hypothetical protein